MVSKGGEEIKMAMVLLFILGLALLIGGAELLVRGASRLAGLAGISPLIIGLTVVAFGTSSPELAVSIRSSLLSSAGADIALGNVVGSNIFNVLFILGLSALVEPLSVSRQLVRIDVPIMVGISLLLFFMALDGRVGRIDGLVLFLGILAYTLFTIRQGRKAGNDTAETQRNESGDGRYIAVGSVMLMVIGLAMLVLGSHWLVRTAVVMAERLGISDLVVGLTVVAAGTSLPEAATSVIASVKGERDIAVGNVVGSNIFNILSVLGLSALVGSHGIRVPLPAMWFDIPILIAAAAVCLPVFITGFRISRLEGLLFVGYYLLYTLYLVMAGAHHKSLPFLTHGILFFVLPLTGIMILIPLYLQIRKGSVAGPYHPRR